MLFFQFDIFINILVSSFCFIYIPICYGSTNIKHVYIPSVRATAFWRRWVERRQIWTSKVDPRAARVKRHFKIHFHV